MPGLSRRRLLALSAGLTPLFLGSPLLPGSSPASAASGDGRSLFTLGVASGDPWPDGVVLWTRLAPDPVHGGGMGPEPVAVTWEVAGDEKMEKIVRRGTALATPELAHSLHVEVDGLDPGRPYWYRFRTTAEASVVGRTRTAPAPSSQPARLRFALCSCQDYSHGYFTPHRQIAGEDLDLVAFVGDYIYEGLPEDGRARRHNDQDTVTLEEYRNRYALYKTDPDLQAMHAAHPWVATWDDHEVDNDYAGLQPSWDLDPAAFLARRTAAYRAYYEHLPLRRLSLPNGKDLRLYRHLAFGGLAEFEVLDTRQYRDPLPCRTESLRTCTEYRSPDRSILGAEQEAWLFDRLKETRARWTFITEQVPIMRLALPGRGEPLDKWDGYVGARERLFAALTRYKTPNPVVLSGDSHQAWAGELKADFDRPESASLGVEFSCTSMTAGGDGQRSPEVRAEVLAANPHVKYGDGKRGYTSFDVTAKTCRVDFRTVDYVSRPGSPVRIARTFVVEDGRPKLIED